MCFCRAGGCDIFTQGFPTLRLALPRTLHFGPEFGPGVSVRRPWAAPLCISLYSVYGFARVLGGRRLLTNIPGRHILGGPPFGTFFSINPGPINLMSSFAPLEHPGKRPRKPSPAPLQANLAHPAMFPPWCTDVPSTSASSRRSSTARSMAYLVDRSLDSTYTVLVTPAFNLPNHQCSGR